MQTTPYYPLYINGEFRDSAGRQVVINPATGGVIAEVAVADAKDASFALSSARLVFDKGEWPRISLARRRQLLLKISQGILDNAGQLAKLETLNTGKPIKESTFMDIPSAAKAFEHFANNLEKYLQGESVDLENAESHRARAAGGGGINRSLELSLTDCLLEVGRGIGCRQYRDFKALKPDALDSLGAGQNN
jgi:acyl-CoA reductase-like NAD-dependent aldehyde dehydrogenase